MTWVEVSEEGYWSLNNPPLRNGWFGEMLCLCIDGEYVQARVFVRGRYCLVTISPSDTSHKDAGFSTRTRPKGAVAAAIPLESLNAGAFVLDTRSSDARGMLSALGSCVRSRAGR